jgi:hypothetical protein
MQCFSNPIQKVKNFLLASKSEPMAGQHIAPAQGVQARLGGPKESDAKRQHITGREDGRRR